MGTLDIQSFIFTSGMQLAKWKARGIFKETTVFKTDE